MSVFWLRKATRPALKCTNCTHLAPKPQSTATEATRAAFVDAATPATPLPDSRFSIVAAQVLWVLKQLRKDWVLYCMRKIQRMCWAAGAATHDGGVV